MRIFKSLSDNKQGIVYAVMASLFVSLMIALVRQLSSNYHVFFIVMVRNFFAFMFFMPQIMRDYKSVLKTDRIELHIMRGINGLMAMFVWFYAVSILPLSEAVSISFMAPILTTIAAVYVLKEKVGKNGWIALAIGIAGIIIILRPGFREFKMAYIFCFASVVMWTITNILIKIMIKTEKPQTIVAYMSLIMLIISIPFAIPYLKAISWPDLIRFILIGALSNLGHVSISLSYSKADISLLQPFDFTRLVFTIIISYFAFGETIDFWVIFGSIVIFFGVIVVAPHEKLRKKEALAIE